MISLRLAILKDLVEALRQVSRQAGYNTDLGQIVREYQGTDPDEAEGYFGAGDHGAVVELRSGSRAEASGYTTADLQFYVHVWARFTPSRAGSISALEALEPAIVDVERAVLVDDSRGGLAVGTQPESFTITEDGDGKSVVWCHYVVRVQYQHDYEDPRALGLLSGEES